MRISGTSVVAALMLLSQVGSPVMAGSASRYLVAQADKPADSAPAPAPSAAPSPAPVAGAPQEGTAMKSAISTPACYVKYL